MRFNELSAPNKKQLRKGVNSIINNINQNDLRPKDRRCELGQRQYRNKVSFDLISFFYFFKYHFDV